LGPACGGRQGQGWMRCRASPGSRTGTPSRRGRRARCVWREGTNAAQARGSLEQWLHPERIPLSSDHLPFVLIPWSRGDGRLLAGGERCRCHHRVSGCRVRPAGASPHRGASRRWRCEPPPPRSVARGLAGGGFAGHSSAMIASNSARSSCSSAHTSSRKSSSTRRVAPTEAVTAGIRLTPDGQALMARRPSLVPLISILRGLACSATGIFRVRTPLS
jgi:hypothetical protein